MRLRPDHSWDGIMGLVLYSTVHEYSRRWAATATREIIAACLHSVDAEKALAQTGLSCLGYLSYPSAGAAVVAPSYHLLIPYMALM